MSAQDLPAIPHNARCLDSLEAARQLSYHAKQGHWLGVVNLYADTHSFFWLCVSFLGLSASISGSSHYRLPVSDKLLFVTLMPNASAAVVSSAGLHIALQTCWGLRAGLTALGHSKS